jgi:hypothetical protein
MKGKRRGYKDNFECFLAVLKDAVAIQLTKSREKLLFQNRDSSSGKWWNLLCLYIFKTCNQTLDKLCLEKTRMLPQIQTHSPHGYAYQVT